VPDEKDTINFNDKVLKRLIAALGNVPTARVGILGSSDARSMQVQNNQGKLVTETSSNATIGAAHEFGTSTLPQRSFLRQPLTEHLAKELEKSGAFTEETLKKVIASGSARPWTEKVAVAAEAVVGEAFATNGFGKWAPHAAGYENNSGNILVDTTQLRDSITSEVKD
jgi:hypothetical protein